VPLLQGLRWTLESIQSSPPDAGSIVVDVEEASAESQITAEAVIAKPKAKARA
jgi:hypothetical protein